MRRLALFVALALLSAFLALPAGAATPALGCSSPTVMSGYDSGVAYPGGYRVNVDGWTHTGAYTVSSCSPSDWIVKANQKTGVKQVRAYPDGERTYTDWQHCSSQPAISTFTKLASTYSHVAPPGASYDFAFDQFIGSGACSRPLTEIMLWTRWAHVSVPAPQLTPTIDGVRYDIYWVPFSAAQLAARAAQVPELRRSVRPLATGGNYIQIRRHTQADAGGADFVHVFTYLEGQGLLTASDTMMFHRYGVEVLSTHGKDVSFAVNGFTVDDAHT